MGGVPAPDWLASDSAREALAGLDRRMREAVAASDPALWAMATALQRRGGKRIRPALLLVAAEFGADRPAHLLDAAAALELLHLASLYHDDVMDRAVTRRHGPSVNAEWGEPAAVVAGTFLLARAIALLAALDDRYGREAAAAMVALCTGQLRETENAFHTGLTETEHLDIVAGKTATLFELPCRLGALLAGAPAGTVAALAGYGHDLGVAFQLTDDALDVQGSYAALGKRPLTDVREGIYTMSVLRLLARDTPGSARVRELLEVRDPTPAELAEVAEVVVASGTVDDVLAEARERAGRAARRLEPLPPGPARDSLVRLADYAVTRAG
ncbi:polyprenyl synthetase family protein [Micromonospora sp. NPDC005220]|uniref:polyprenyl synthetase family protein n=1 Tax=Micromonospora sp. NPDC005220 TaxID=3155589 RepID=UPI0033BCCD76